MADDSGKEASSSPGKQMRVDSALVRELAELLAANDLSEIEVEDGDRKIRVRRELTVTAAPLAYAAPIAQAPAAVSAADAATAAAQIEADAQPKGDIVRSPMVGTAYLSAEPGSKSFAVPGQAVKEGDTLLIVEAMKVMNPILAPRSGTVTQVMISNAQPVEYDQPLLVIE